jgi:hypothetical protein
MKELILDLMCELGQEELNERAQQLSSTVVRFDEVELEKKNSNKQYADRLNELGGAIRKLSGIVRQRAESRPVKCAVLFHSPTVGTKRIVRKDTGEIVREEPMSAVECQNNLFGGDDAVEVPAAEDQAQATQPDVEG